MAEDWKTLSDYFDPITAAYRVQQLDEARRQNRIRAMQIREAMQQQKNKDEFREFQLNPRPTMAMQMFQQSPQGVPATMSQNAPTGGLQAPIGGPQGVTATPQMQQGPIPQAMPQQTPGGAAPQGVSGQEQAPQMTPEQISANRGVQIYKDLYQKSVEATKKDPIDYKTINASNDMFQNTPDVQNLVKLAGYDKIEQVGDEEKGTVTQSLIRDFSKEDLTALSKKYKGKGGELLEVLPAGKWKINIDAKNDRILPNYESIKTEGLGEKHLTEEQLTYQAKFAPDINTRKQAQEMLDSMQKRRVDIVKATTGAREEERAKWRRDRDLEKKAELHSFSSWTPEQKKYMFDRENTVGEKPKFAFGDRESYTTYQQEHAQYNIENGITPSMAGTSAAMFKSLEGSLKQQEKSLGSMGSFVINLNKQLTHANELLSKLPRTSSRLLNIPIWKLRTTVMGSGEEAAAKAYLLEISNEVAKLSTNSQASIRELSTDAQERWAKIHDELLPYGELIKVLDETQRLGNMRLESTKEQLNLTLNRMETINPSEFTDKYRNKNKEEAAEWMKVMPTPVGNEGKIIEDDNGNRWKSDGKTWRKL